MLAQEASSTPLTQVSNSRTAAQGRPNDPGRASDSGRASDLVLIVETLAEEIGRLRKNLAEQQRQQAQQHKRLEQGMAEVRQQLRGDAADDAESPRSEITQTVTEAQLGPNQLRALLTFDQSLAQLLILAGDGSNASPDATVADAPMSIREGLDMLQIRVRNLQRSMGLEPVPSVGQQYDPEIHRIERHERRPGVPAGQVLAEVLPGYRYQGELVRPARVVVNEL